MRRLTTLIAASCLACVEDRFVGLPAVEGSNLHVVIASAGDVRRVEVVTPGSPWLFDPTGWEIQVWSYPDDATLGDVVALSDPDAVVEQDLEPLPPPAAVHYLWARDRWSRATAPSGALVRVVQMSRPPRRPRSFCYDGPRPLPSSGGRAAFGVVSSTAGLALLAWRPSAAGSVLEHTPLTGDGLGRATRWLEVSHPTSELGRPALSADGLELYFSVPAGRDPPKSQIVVARRARTSERFGTTQYIEGNLDENQRWPVLLDRDRVLATLRGGPGDRHEIAVLLWRREPGPELKWTPSQLWPFPFRDSVAGTCEHRDLLLRADDGGLEAAPLESFRPLRVGASTLVRVAARAETKDVVELPDCSGLLLRFADEGPIHRARAVDCATTERAPIALDLPTDAHPGNFQIEERDGRRTLLISRGDISATPRDVRYVRYPMPTPTTIDLEREELVFRETGGFRYTYRGQISPDGRSFLLSVAEAPSDWDGRRQLRLATRASLDVPFGPTVRVGELEGDLASPVWLTPERFAAIWARSSIRTYVRRGDVFVREDEIETEGELDALALSCDGRELLGVRYAGSPRPVFAYAIERWSPLGLGARRRVAAPPSEDELHALADAPGCAGTYVSTKRYDWGTLSFRPTLSR